jgi:putative heme iron utilization protein
VTDHAALCRDLVARASSATLSTHAREPEGFPHGSLVAVAADDAGRPLLLLSTLAEHTGNLLARPEVSLLFVEPTAPGGDPLAGGRVTLLGTCAALPEAEVAAARTAFLARHPSAAQYVDFADFAFYRVMPRALRYVGGFGRMSWVASDAYLA